MVFRSNRYVEIGEKMKILDFTTNRRSYLISKCKEDTIDYKFYYHSGRKIYLTENRGDLGDVQQYCPEILSNKIDISKLEEMNDRDVVIVTSMSMLFKEYERRAFQFLNSFPGKVVAVDYAWEAPRKAHKRAKNGFKRNIDAIAVVGDLCKYSIPAFYYSQPEVDIYAHVNDFLSPDDIVNKYELPPAEKYILVTSHDNYKVVPSFLNKIKQYGDIHLIWKLKEKKSNYADTVTKIMRKNNFNRYTLVIGPPNRSADNPNSSHKDFFSPVAEVSRIISCHIDMPPVSYSNMEMIRAGIPTYVFDGENFCKPRMLGDFVEKIFDILWTKDSIQNCYSGSLCTDRSKCSLQVDKYFFTKNFLINLEKFING